MNKNHFKLKFVALFTLLFSLQSMATVIFSEDFESNLSQWTGKNGGAHSGVIVADPLNGTNNVLSFNGLNSAGDIFTLGAYTSNTSTFTLAFDYLGDPSRGGVANDLGGYIGLSLGFPDSHYWVAGTGSYSTPFSLIDDGTWHHYEFTFSSPIGNTVHFMLEDWSGSGGVAGDIFFDNIIFGDSDTVASIPEPTSLMIVLIGLIGFSLRKRA